MTSPKVSVIVCTYNQEHTIRRALESILNQKVDFPYEIILADDCSQDNTPNICLDYAKQYPDIIRLYTNKQNKGLVNNYFDSIEECNGVYIADLAGDDEWTDPYKLKKQVQLMDSDKDIVLCHADWEAVFPDGTSAPSNHWRSSSVIISDADGLTETLLKHDNEKYFIHLCTSIYRRDVIVSLMKNAPKIFRDKFYTCEDLQIKVMMARVGKIAYIPDKVLNYSVGIPSVSSTENPLKTIRFYSGVIILTLRLADYLGIKKYLLKDYIASVMQYIIMQYFISEDKEGRQLVRNLLQIEKIQLSLKNKITLFLSSNNFVWKVTKNIRQIIRRKK